jgi:uncharacterized protein YegP (UPF0339 family)
MCLSIEQEFYYDGCPLPRLTSPGRDAPYVAGKFRFRLKSGNGEIIAVGEAYDSKPAVLNGIDSSSATPPTRGRRPNLILEASRRHVW